MMRAMVKEMTMAITMYLVSRYSDGQFLGKCYYETCFWYPRIEILPIMCLQQEVLVVKDVVTLIVDYHQIG